MKHKKVCNNKNKIKTTSALKIISCNKVIFGVELRANHCTIFRGLWLMSKISVNCSLLGRNFFTSSSRAVKKKERSKLNKRMSEAQQQEKKFRAKRGRFLLILVARTERSSPCHASPMRACVCVRKVKKKSLSKREDEEIAANISFQNIAHFPNSYGLKSLVKFIIISL
jgi:hypothetical protein